MPRSLAAELGLEEPKKPILGDIFKRGLEEAKKEALRFPGRALGIQDKPEELVTDPGQLLRKLTFGYPVVAGERALRTLAVQKALKEQFKPSEIITKDRQYTEIPGVEEGMRRGLTGIAPFGLKGLAGKAPKPLMNIGAELGGMLALGAGAGILSEAVSGLKPAQLTTKATKQVGDKLLKNPRYQELINRTSQRTGYATEEIHNATLREVFKQFQKKPYLSKLRVGLGEAGFAGVKKVPVIKNTAEALKLGQAMRGDTAKIALFETARKGLLDQAAKLKGVKGRETEGHQLAVRAQLLREAVGEATKEPQKLLPGKQAVLGSGFTVTPGEGRRIPRGERGQILRTTEQFLKREPFGLIRERQLAEAAKERASIIKAEEKAETARLREQKKTLGRIIKQVEKPSILPPSKVKPVIRLSTGKYDPNKITIKEPQALREVLKREEKASKVASRLTKRETKETLGLIRKIKKLPIEDMAFEEKQAIEGLKIQLKTTKTLQGLRELYDQAQKTKQVGRDRFLQTKQVKDNQFALDKDLLVKTIGAEKTLRQPIGLRAEEPKLGKALAIPKTFRATTLRPARIFDMFDKGQNFEGPHSQFFFNRANLSENAKLTAINSRTTRMDGEIKRLGFNLNQLQQIREIDDVKFTVDEMISIYTAAKNKEKTLAIVFGNNISFGTMRNIIAQMTPQEKALGDAIIKDYETNYQRLRKTFAEYTNGTQDLGRVTGGYTPIRRTMQGYNPTENELANELLERTNLKKAYAERGFTKERVKVPKEFQQPIRLGEMNLWIEQMEKQEHFIANGNLVKELQKMVNNKDFSEAITNKFGKEFLEVTKNWVNRVANPNIYKTYSQLDKVTSALRQNAAIAYLGFNITTMGKQLPSLALFLDDVTVPQLMSGIYDLTTNFKETMAFIQKMSPQMKNRSIERELEELKNKDPNKYNEIIKRFGRKAMFGIYEMDKLVTHSGWLAVYNKFTGPKFNLSPQEAADRATRAVLRTQPAAHAKDIADLYASAPSSVYNLITQFTNQLNQLYNIVTYDIPAKAQAKDFRGAIRAAFGVALSAIGIYTMTNGRPPRNIKDLIDGGIETGLSYIPIFGRGFASKQRGFDFLSVPAFAGIEKAGDAIKFTAKGEFGKAGEKALESLAVLGGIPFSQPRKFIKGGGALLRGETQDPRRLMLSEFALKGRKKKGKSLASELGLGSGKKKSLAAELGL